MTTTTNPPFRYESAGKAYNGNPKWDVFSTMHNGVYLGYVSGSTSKRGGTVWSAVSPMGLRSAGGWRNRTEASEHLLRHYEREVTDVPSEA